MKGALYLIAFIFAIGVQACAQQKTDSASRKPDTTKAIPPRPDLLRKIPQPIGWINDYAFLFTNDQVRRLDSLVSDYEKQTTIEIAVVTIDGTRTSQKDFDEFTLLMANTWGVGKKETSNGILIAIAADLRRIRINNGYGIEKVLSSEKTKEIIDSVFIPHFKENKYFEGTMQGIIAIIKALPPKN